jgi:mannan endo-1,4-beta-mannosidase
MVAYLTVTKGLHNLLFTYSPNAVGCDCAAPAMSYYPGSAYVDVVGIDVYNNSMSVGGKATYDAMVATGKPFGFAEFGQGSNASYTGTGTMGSHWDLRTLTHRAQVSYPAMAYAIAWYSSFGGNGKLAYVYGLSDVAHLPAVLKDPLVRTLPVSAP